MNGSEEVRTVGALISPPSAQPLLPSPSPLQSSKEASEPVLKLLQFLRDCQKAKQLSSELSWLVVLFPSQRFNEFEERVSEDPELR